MISTLFCPTCGAANETTQMRCFACGAMLLNNGTGAQDGTLLLGRYQILATLGTGGFSRVYQAQDTHTGQAVAIKQINLHGLTPEETIDATHTFNREKALLASINHSQVPRLFAHFQDREHWYLVLEYLDGPTLETYLETRQGQGKPILFAEALSMILQVCRVLEYLHSRQPAIIFRDLKPGNIIRHSGDKLSLIDFGIARHYQRGRVRDTQLLGSPGYAAPEQYGRAQTSPQSDIYSLGVLFYALLSGEDPSQRDPDLTMLRLQYQPGGAQVLVLLEQMLASDPGARPRSVREVRSELEGLQQFQSNLQDRGRIWIPPTPQTYVTTSGGQQYMQSHISVPTQRRMGRRRVLIGGLGILAAVSGGGYLLWQNQPRSPQLLNPYYVYRGHKNSVTGISWSPDGQSVASLALDDTLQIWRVSSQNDRIVLWGSETEGGVCWSPGGARIAFSSQISDVTVCNATNGIDIFNYSGHHAAVAAVAYDPSGANVASASDDTTVQVWDSQSGIISTNYANHTGAVNALSWSPDGSQIASASDDGTVRVWDVTTGSTLVTFSGHSGSVRAVAWSPDGLSVASGSTGTEIKIWNPTNGSELLTYLGHRSSINAVTWSPDSSQLASASDDMTVQILNASGNGALSSTYAGHSAAVLTVAWSPDGKFIASGSADKTVQVWKPGSGS